MVDRKQGVCVVVGAGDGLGAAIARASRAKGLTVCVTRRPRHIDEVRGARRAHPRRGAGARLRARRAKGGRGRRAGRRDRADVGPLEVVVFNIGANVRFPVVETTAQVYSKVWEMAAFAGFLTGREAARVMARGAGDDPLHRRDGEPARRRRLFRLRQRKHALRALARASRAKWGPKASMSRTS